MLRKFGMSKTGEDEEAFRKLAVEVRFLESTAEAIQSRINFVNAALTELRYAKETLEGIEKQEVDVPLLVPIGGGSYVKAKLESRDTVILGIGAGVAVEKSLKDAKETLSKRMEELEKVRSNLQQQLTQVLNRIEADRAKLGEISERIAGRQTDVRKAQGGT